MKPVRKENQNGCHNKLRKENREEGEESVLKACCLQFSAGIPSKSCVGLQNPGQSSILKFAVLKEGQVRTSEQNIHVCPKSPTQSECITPILDTYKLSLNEYIK